MNIFLSKSRSKCLMCRQEFFDEDAEYDCIFPGSEAEPPEWSTRCPHCNSNNIQEISLAFCRTCNDVVVADEGEECSECRTIAAEALFDSMMDR